MNGEQFKPRPILGTAHVLVGIATLVPAAIAGIWFAPLVMGPLWFCVLGVWLWRPSHRLRVAMIATHAVMAVLSLLNIALGISALHAGAMSAAKGGGIMSGFGVLPIICGVSLLVLAAVSLWVSFTMRAETKPPDSTSHEITPGTAR